MKITKIFAVFSIIVLTNCMQSYSDSVDKITISGMDSYSYYDSMAYLYYKKDYKKCIEYAEKAAAIADLNNETENVILYLNMIGCSWQSHGFYRLAREKFQKAEDLARESRNEEWLYNTMTNIGFLCQETGKYDKALELNLTLLELIPIKKNQKKIGIMNNIGSLYYQVNQLEKSLKYFNEAKSLFDIRTDSLLYASILNNSGLVYNAKKEYDKALANYNEALNIFESYDNSISIAKTLHNIGLVYLDMGRYTKAEIYLLKSLRMKDDLHDTISIINSYSNLGNLYEEKSEYIKAHNYYHSALKIVKDKALTALIPDCYYNLFSLHKTTKNFEKALEYYQKYIEAQNLINDNETKQKIAELELLHDIETKEKENEKLKAESEAKTNRNIILFILILALIIIAVIFLFRYLSNKKMNKILQGKNNLISETNKQLQLNNEQINRQSKKLSELNATKDKFFSILAHDLKNPFWLILEMSELIVKKAGNMAPEKINEAAKIMNDSAKNTFAFLENLLNWSRSQTGKIQFVPELIKMKSLIATSVELYQNQADSKEIDFIVNCEDNASAFADRNMLIIILNNLVSNAIKYSNKNSQITLLVKSDDSFVYITVSDKGVGMDNKVVEKLFKIEESFSYKGTSGEPGTGLGLILCKEFAERNSGRIDVKSEKNQGTDFTVSLPISPDK